MDRLRRKDGCRKTSKERTGEKHQVHRKKGIKLTQVFLL